MKTGRHQNGVYKSVFGTDCFCISCIFNGIPALCIQVSRFSVFLNTLIKPGPELLLARLLKLKTRISSFLSSPRIRRTSLTAAAHILVTTRAVLAGAAPAFSTSAIHLSPEIRAFRWAILHGGCLADWGRMNSPTLFLTQSFWRLLIRLSQPQNMLIIFILRCLSSN